MGPLDEVVQEVLKSEIDLGGRRITVLQATKLRNVPLSEAGHQPSAALVQAVEAAIRDRLTVAQKQQLFGFVGWRFQCRTCFQAKGAEEFDSRGFTFWGDVAPPQVQLRSGPCNSCRDLNGGRENPVGGVSYKMVMPE